MSIRNYIGTRKFYRTALLIAVPIMIQNGITNFVGLLDNIMVGRIGTVEMTGVSIANTLIFVFNLAVFGGIRNVRLLWQGPYKKPAVSWQGRCSRRPIRVSL